MRAIRYQNQNWLPLLDWNGKSVNTTGRPIYVRESQQKAFSKIAKAARTDFHQCNLYRQILKLKNLGYMTSLINKSSPTDRVFPMNGGMLVYTVDGKGIIYLKNVLAKSHFRFRGHVPVDGQLKAGEGTFSNSADKKGFGLIGNSARELDKQVGFWRGTGKGLKSLGAGVVKAIGYGGSYWGSKVCSAWSSECAFTHKYIRDEGGRIGLALHDLTTDQAMTALVLSSASNTAEGYATGRAAGGFGLSKMPGPTYLKIGIGAVAVAGNMLQMSEMYGDALTGKHLVEAVLMGAQNDM